MCYLVEWYRPDVSAESFDQTAHLLAGCAALMSAEGTPVRLVMSLAVPTDEVAFGLFVADTAETVTTICQRAGRPAQRVVPALLPGAGLRAAINRC